MFSDLIALLEQLGYPVYDTDVTEANPKYPYYVVWGGEARPHVERPLSSRMLGVQDRIGITGAAGTCEGARMMIASARQILQPGGLPVRVAGYTLTLDDHQAATPDRDEVIAGTNRHPCFAVDIYTVEK